MLSELLGNCQEYEGETYEEFLNRYKGFGKEIYTKLKDELPSIFNDLKFYSAVRSTEKCVGNFPYIEDSYAIFDDGEIMFIIQLDPETEVICLSNWKTQIEIGVWEQIDFYKESIDFIKKEFLKTKN